ncbi:heme ABC transporter ATP-binding protein [Amorphus sp. MBR-141]
MLTAETIGVWRGGRWLVEGISLDVAPGARIAILGPNGAGKSTLLKVLVGETPPDTGRVLLDGTDLQRMPRSVLARRRAVLPQASVLTFPFTVREVAALGVTVPAFPIDRTTQLRLVERALAAVGLAALSEATFDTLSGGEKQRAQLARVLCQLWACEAQGPMPLLFLDEPTASQDLAQQLAILQVASEHARRGGAVVAILHDINLAAAWADRLLVLSKGRLYADGRPQNVVTQAMLADVFRVGLSPGALPDGSVPFVLPQTAVRLDETDAVPSVF